MVFSVQKNWEQQLYSPGCYLAIQSEQLQFIKALDMCTWYGQINMTEWNSSSKGLQKKLWTEIATSEYNAKSSIEIKIAN